MYPNHTDGQLILMLQSGDLNALGTLYERYKSSVYQTAIAITRDPSVAEDILQDCFLRLHRYAESINTALPLKPWLYRVTVNLAYSFEKRRKRWQIPLDRVIQSLVSPSQHSPEYQAEISDQHDEIMEAVFALNLNQRVVITLFYLNSLNLEEIASILKCPVGTVKSRLFYGRENIRRHIGKSLSAPAEVAYEYV
jgi:RNA polymerase sigma-70 factor (ECF subfamily)